MKEDLDLLQVFKTYCLRAKRLAENVDQMKEDGIDFTWEQERLETAVELKDRYCRLLVEQITLCDNLAEGRNYD